MADHPLAPPWVKTLVSMPTSESRPRCAIPPTPAYSPSVFSRTKSRSMSSAATHQRARHALEQPRRAEVRPEIQALPDRQDRPPQRDVIRHRRVSERPEQHRVELAQLIERVLGHHPALLVEERGAPRQLRPLKREAQRIDDAPSLRRDLRADPVAGNQRDAVAQAAPQRITESTHWANRTEARFVPKNADAPFLSTTVSTARAPVTCPPSNQLYLPLSRAFRRNGQSPTSSSWRECVPCPDPPSRTPRYVRSGRT